MLLYLKKCCDCQNSFKYIIIKSNNVCVAYKIVLLVLGEKQVYVINYACIILFIFVYFQYYYNINVLTIIIINITHKLSNWQFVNLAEQCSQLLKLNTNIVEKNYSIYCEYEAT